MTQHLDMHGNDIKKGDWVRYPWWNPDRNVFEYFCGRVRRVARLDDTTIYVRSYYGKSSVRCCEKLPANASKRKQYILLKALEGHTSTTRLREDYK